MLANRSDFKPVVNKIAQCFPSGIKQFLRHQAVPETAICILQSIRNAENISHVPDFQFRLCYASRLYLFAETTAVSFNLSRGKCSIYKLKRFCIFNSVQLRLL